MTFFDGENMKCSSIEVMVSLFREEAVNNFIAHLVGHPHVVCHESDPNIGTAIKVRNRYFSSRRWNEVMESFFDGEE